MSHKEKNQLPLALRLLLIILASSIALALSYAVLSLPEQAAGLGDYSSQNIEKSGVINPVTAVLLNYRAYDTFLELGVLLLALLGVWSLRNSVIEKEAPKSAMLDTLTRSLIPIFIIVAGYLLWAGAYFPGGAFQAGAILAAAGVLFLLAGWRINARFSGLILRLALVSGLVVFAVVGALFILTGRQLLEYPPEYAGLFILLIETVATLSIGVSLAALYLGADPEEKNS